MTMKFQGALIKEQGIRFGIAIVKRYVLENRGEAARIASSFGSVFGPIPIVLMAQDTSGRPTYFGRPDIVRFLSRVPVSAIPWREYSIA